MTVARQSGWERRRQSEFEAAADSDVMIGLSREVRKPFFGVPVLIVAERQSAFTFDCRVGGLPTWTMLSIECGAAAITVDIHLEDGGVVDEAINSGERHGLVWKNLAPFAEGLIGSDQH
jgi:hypothetical protein